MKKTTFIAVALSAFLHLNASAQQEVVSARENVTTEEIYKQINDLAQKDSEEAKAQLKLEADVLAQANDDERMNLAASIYERLLSDAESANKVKEEITTRFPNGKVARNKEYGKIFEDESADIPTLEANYQAWLEKFPPANFGPKDQDIYAYPLITIGQKYAQANDFEKALDYAKRTKGSNFYVYAVNNLVDKTENKDYQLLLPLVEDAYQTAKQASESEDESIKSSNNAQMFNSISSTYAQVLGQNGKNQEASEIAEKLLTASNYGGSSALKNTKTLAEAYIKLGKKEDAFQVYEKFLTANGAEESIVADAKKLYIDIHGNNSTTAFDTLLSSLDEKASAALFAKYEKDMIKQEAPDFTLVNREGKEVSLADYKGKVVILDFWATWCGPCIVSFPGMQAAVNKYANDPEVEFLFIDTWQNEENYKELVENFITEKNYNFHVLFDEMKDRSKAVVTAYGVKGIPTKVVIDKEGFIRFQNSGSEANVDKLVKELDTKIALAKKG